MSALPCITNSRPGVSLYSPIGSGGGGIPANPDLTVSTLTAATSVSTTALFVSSINGAAPGGGGGGGVDPAGISTNKVVTATGTTLTLNTGSGANIVMDGNKSIIQLTPGGEAGSIQFYAASLQAVGSCDLTISSINGASPGGGGGGITPFQSTIGLLPTPITCPAGTFQTVANTYPLVAGHTYTASFNCSYALNTSDTNNGIRIDFDVPGGGTSIGPVYSPPAFMNNATSSDGAPIAASLTWTQYADSAKGGVYITPSGTGYDCIINSVIAGSDPRLVITDWGAL